MRITYPNPFSCKIILTVCMFMISHLTFAQDFLEMSLEDLMNIEVTSVSKKSERLQDVASAIYVVNSDDIMRSGATTLHEVLRNVPGYWGVQDEYSSVFATIRNTPSYNVDPQTVLYLLDGTPIQEIMGQTFSFKNFDIPLDEIDRIEIISGSGGTIYGANSATGVISIFTRDPEKYDGINARAEGAYPGYVTASLRAGGKISDKLAISGYGKYRYFNGFESIAGQDEDGNQLVSSRFSENYDKSSYYSLGAKLSYRLSDNDKISARAHFNGRNKVQYTNSYDTSFLFTRTDILYKNDVNANRTVANIRYDHNFNETHQLFFRTSTNIENDFYRLAGGFDISNSIYDFELQDNISIGELNDFSAGLNYRLVNFDIHNINAPDQIRYTDPQANEALIGAFMQDKLKLLDGKLNFIAGIKAENYSLVNDKYYFSPMGKVSVIPNEYLTLWGGFTQSYTTPGFNNTNIDLFLIQQPSDQVYDAFLRPGFTAAATEGLFNQSFQQAIDQGNDEGTAQAIAEGTVNSPGGQQFIADTVASSINQVKALTPNTVVKNGTRTVPTRFQTWEIGFKSSLKNKLQLNSTFFYTRIKDGVTNNPGPTLEISESITQPGRTASYFLYGNFLKGESIGSESIVRYFPIDGLLFEFSHTWLEMTWEYQDNPELENVTEDQIDPITDDPNPRPGFAPKHVFRFRADYSFGNGFNINMQLISARQFRTNSGFEYDYFLRRERYKNLAENLIENNLDSGLGLVFDDDQSIQVSTKENRTILNLRIEKSMLENKLTVYAFGNDITNDGIIANTDHLRNVSLSQIAGMYGIGANYKFN